MRHLKVNFLHMSIFFLLVYTAEWNRLHQGSNKTGINILQGAYSMLTQLQPILRNELFALRNTKQVAIQQEVVLSPYKKASITNFPYNKSARWIIQTTRISPTQQTEGFSCKNWQKIIINGKNTDFMLRKIPNMKTIPIQSKHHAP